MADPPNPKRRKILPPSKDDNLTTASHHDAVGRVGSSEDDDIMDIEEDGEEAGPGEVKTKEHLDGTTLFDHGKFRDDFALLLLSTRGMKDRSRDLAETMKQFAPIRSPQSPQLKLGGPVSGWSVSTLLYFVGWNIGPSFREREAEYRREWIKCFHEVAKNERLSKPKEQQRNRRRRRGADLSAYLAQLHMNQLRTFWKEFCPAMKSGVPRKQEMIAVILELYHTGRNPLQRNREELEVLKTMDPEQIFCELCGIVIPKDVIKHILRYFGFSRSTLDGIGLANWNFYTAVYTSWNQVTITSRNFVRIPRVVLQAVTNLRIEGDKILMTSFADLFRCVNPARVASIRLLSFRTDILRTTCRLVRGLQRSKVVLTGLRTLIFHPRVRICKSTSSHPEKAFPKWSESLNAVAPNLRVVWRPRAISWCRGLTQLVELRIHFSFLVDLNKVAVTLAEAKRLSILEMRIPFQLDLSFLVEVAPRLSFLSIRLLDIDDIMKIAPRLISRGFGMKILRIATVKTLFKRPLRGYHELFLDVASLQPRDQMRLVQAFSPKYVDLKPSCLPSDGLIGQLWNFAFDLVATGSTKSVVMPGFGFLTENTLRLDLDRFGVLSEFLGRLSVRLASFSTVLLELSSRPLLMVGGAEEAVDDTAVLEEYFKTNGFNEIKLWFKAKGRGQFCGVISVEKFRAKKETESFIAKIKRLLPKDAKVIVCAKKIREE